MEGRVGLIYRRTGRQIAEVFAELKYYLCEMGHGFWQSTVIEKDNKITAVLIGADGSTFKIFEIEADSSCSQVQIISENLTDMVKCMATESIVKIGFLINIIR